MSSIEFPHLTITVLIFILTIFSFWLRTKTSLERCARSRPRRNLSILEKLSLAGIVFWGLHNVNVVALEIWCSFENKFHHFFTYEVLTWTVCKSLDYSIMFVKSKHLQREPALQIKNAKTILNVFLISASIVFMLDVTSVVLNVNREGTSFTQDCVLQYSTIEPSQDELSFIITAIYVFFEPVATITGLYLFIKPLLKSRKVQRTVAVAPVDPAPAPNHPNSDSVSQLQLEQRHHAPNSAIKDDNSDTEQKKNEVEPYMPEDDNTDTEEKKHEVEPYMLGEAQQRPSNILMTALKWNCIGVCSSQLSVWLVNMQWFFSEDLAAWLKIHYWIHPFDAYFHILCIHMVFLDFQTISNMVKRLTKASN